MGSVSAYMLGGRKMIAPKMKKRFSSRQQGPETHVLPDRHSVSSPSLTRMGRGYIHCAPVLSVTAAQKTLEAERATVQSRELSLFESEALLPSSVVRLYGGWPGGKICNPSRRESINLR